MKEKNKTKKEQNTKTKTINFKSNINFKAMAFGQHQKTLHHLIGFNWVFNGGVRYASSIQIKIFLTIRNTFS